MKKNQTGNLCLLTVLLLMLTKLGAYGQCNTIQTRVYANEQRVNKALLTSIDTADNASDGNPVTYSRLNIPLGVGELITITQYIKFDNSLIPINKNTPVTVKVSLPKGLLSLLGGVEIQPFKNLRNNISTLFTWQATPVGPALSGASLLGLLNGSGDKEITISSMTEGYDGVWVRMSGIAVLQNINVFDAYIKKDVTSGTLGCSTPIDVLSGVRASTALGDIANATGDVSDPYKAIDGSDGTAAELKLGAQVLSEVYHTTIFNTQSQPGDYVRMLIEDSDGGLLSLASLSTLSIQLYNGSTPVGTAIDKNSGLLSLSLFPGSTTKKYLNIIPPAESTFDRVEVQIGGLLGASLFSTGIKIYDVKRIITAPNTRIDGAPTVTKAVCPGGTATLSVETPISCAIYNWYNVASGGISLHTGTSFTPDASSLLNASNDYYVEISRPGCTDVSARSKSTITVNPPPAITPGTHTKVCRGNTIVALPYTAPTNNPTTYNVTWDAAAAAQHFADVPDSTLPADSIDLPIPENAAPATYNGSIIVKNANGCISSNTPISVTVDPLPSPPEISLTN